MRVFFNIFAGVVGFVIAPEQLELIIITCGSVWALIDGFYNRQPAKPKEGEEKCDCGKQVL